MVTVELPLRLVVKTHADKQNVLKFEPTSAPAQRSDILREETYEDL